MHAVYTCTVYILDQSHTLAVHTSQRSMAKGLEGILCVKTIMVILCTYLGPRLRSVNRNLAKYVSECSRCIPLVINEKSCRRGILRTMKANRAIGAVVPGHCKNITVEHMLTMVGPLMHRWEGPVCLRVNDKIFWSDVWSSRSAAAWSVSESDRSFRWLEGVKQLQEFSLEMDHFCGTLECFVSVLRGCGRALRSLSWRLPTHFGPENRRGELTLSSWIYIFSQLTLLPSLRELRLQALIEDVDNVKTFGDPVPPLLHYITPFSSLRTLVLDLTVEKNVDHRSFMASCWGCLPQSLEELTLVLKGDELHPEVKRDIEVQAVQLQRLTKLKALHLSGDIILSRDMMHLNLESLVDLSLSGGSGTVRMQPRSDGNFSSDSALKLFLGRLLHLKSLALRNVIHGYRDFELAAIEINNMKRLEKLVIDDDRARPPEFFYRSDLERIRQELNLGQKPNLKMFVAWPAWAARWA
jgi:hypothetical protein